MGKLRHSPCASMAEYPVHSCLGSESMFQQSPGSLKRKTCKASHPGTLPAACPSDMDKRWPQGTTARAAPSGNRDVTLRSACRRSPQAQCAIVYSKHRLSAGTAGVNDVLDLAYTAQQPQLRAKCLHLHVSSVSASNDPEQ